jgi:hypothetical protein
MEDLKNTIIVCITLVAVIASGIGGCTYIVTENNRQYYDTMRQCIDGGGTFVPTTVNSSSAACLRR